MKTTSTIQEGQLGVARQTKRTARMMRRSHASGFTLIELLVSLLAGLFVGLGIMALSREATNTFHEETRVAAAESNARGATDRLRADIQRGGYMSTGNIVADPLIARAPTDTNITKISSTYVGLRRLASIRLIQGGSQAATQGANSLANLNSLNPDAVELGGNFTSTEQFVVRNVDAPTGGCQKIWLATDAPGIWRIKSIGTYAGEALRQMFQPVPNGQSNQFIVRIADDTGKFQYVPTCESTAPAGFSGSDPYISVALNTDNVGIMTANSTQTFGGQSGFGVGRLSVNPVQIVRWHIEAAEASTSANYGTLNATNDGSKFDLVRYYVDAKGATVPETKEIIAEYAIDFGLAFTVESSADLTATAPVLTTFGFDSATNADWAYDVTSKTHVAGTGPHMIRSARMRLVTRAASADRKVNITPNPANVGAQRFLYRYCLGPTATECNNSQYNAWARTRTITSEVSLPNQARNFY